MFYKSYIAGLALAIAAVSAPVMAEPFRIIVTHLEAPLVPNSVLDLAKDLGYFERAGVDVELIRVQQTPSAFAALQAGEGEMANISTDALLQLVAGGADDLFAVISPNKSLPFLIASSAEIATPADLVGKRFGVGRVGSLDYSLSMAVLRDKGLDPEDLDIVALGQPSVRAQALLAKQVDATTMSIGSFVAMPDQSGVHILVGQDSYYETAPVVTKVNVISQKVLEQRRGDVEAVIEAIVTASRDFATDPAIWVDAMVKARPDVDREVHEALSKSYAKSWSINGGLQKAELVYTTDWMYEGDDFAGQRKVGLDEWVDFGPLDAVLKRIGTAPGMDEVSR